MKHSEIERLLPAVFQRAQTPGSPLSAVLDVMESLHEPDENVLANLVSYFNPRWSDPRFLPMLAHWVDIDRIYPESDRIDSGPDWTTRISPAVTGRMRELIALAPRLAQLRGTATGLKLYLETVIGLPFELEEPVTDEDGRAIPFHVRIAAPQESQPQRELIERIVELEKPAYITYDLTFASSPARRKSSAQTSSGD